MAVAGNRPARAAAPGRTILSDMNACPGIAERARRDAAHPELRAVALFEGLKGALSLAAAAALAFAGAENLQHWTTMLLSRLGASQGLAASSWLQRAINPDSVQLAALAVTAYGLCASSKPGVCGAPARGRPGWAASRPRSTCRSNCTPRSAIPAGSRWACSR